MGDDLATAEARRVFLRTSGLDRGTTRYLHALLSSRTGLHSTGDLAAHLGVTRQTALRRLRLLKRYGLAVRVAGKGRVGESSGGRHSALWGSVPGETIEGIVDRVVGRVTRGQQLAREKPA